MMIFKVLLESNNIWQSPDPALIKRPQKCSWHLTLMKIGLRVADYLLHQMMCSTFYFGTFKGLFIMITVNLEIHPSFYTQKGTSSSVLSPSARLCLFKIRNRNSSYFNSFFWQIFSRKGYI